LPWRKHDWPDRRWDPVPPHGHQASDSLLTTWRGQAAIVQTFDFGDEGRAFGRFDGGRGDGGQLLLALPEGVAIAATEDGATGLAYFQRADCQAGGWLVAGRPTAAWQERVVGLRLLPSPDACPTALDLSLTRWRVLRTELPFLREGQAGGVFSAPTLISEHYSHASIPSSDHLERFWMARGLGLVRWERWETSDPHGAAPNLVASGRCPDVAGADPPGPGWYRLDCRFWTNFVPGPARPESWPAATSAASRR
jgi:hypothetical protein